MRVEITVAPTCRPIDLESLKRQLRVEIGYTEEDEHLNSLIDAAQRVVENITNRKLSTQVATLYLDQFPAIESIDVPFYPLRSVSATGITYTGSSGGTTSFSSTKWGTDIVSEPGRVILNYDDDWPTDTLGQNNPVKIRFNCGYKSTEIPGNIKLAVKMLAAHFYENREATINVTGSEMKEIPLGVKDLIYSERGFTF